MLRRTPLRFALLASLLTACADTAIPGYSRETAPDGRTIVSYAAGLPAAEDTLVALFEIGKYLDDSSPIFADLRDIAIGDDGRIYALDFQTSEIRVFTDDGTPDTTLSRSGEGPGEISQANGLGFGPDGTLWVNDHGKGMLLALDTKGRERVRHQSVIPGFSYRWAVTIDTAGVMWEPWGRQLTGPERDRAFTGIVEGRSLRMLRSFDPAGDVRDSVSLDEGSWRSYQASYSNGRMFTTLPFAPRPLMALDQRRRVWVAMSDSYTLLRMNMSADTTLEVRVAETGIPVTPDDIATWRDGFADYKDRLPTLIADLMEFMPASKPPLQMLFSDDQDRLWVGRTVADGEPPRWDVYSVDGDFVTAIRAPVGVTSSMEPLVVGERIYLLASGDAGERYIVVAELPEGLRSR